MCWIMMQLHLTEYLLYFLKKACFWMVNSVPLSFASPAKLVSMFSVPLFTLLITVTKRSRLKKDSRNPAIYSFLLTMNYCLLSSQTDCIDLITHLSRPYFSNFLMKMSCKCQKPNQTDNRLFPIHKACSLLEEKIKLSGMIYFWQIHVDCYHSLVII